MTKTNDASFLLALDIGFDSVKAILASRGQHLEIVGIGSAEHSPGAFTAGVIANLPSVIQTCDSAVASAEQMAGAGITSRQVIMSISGESPDSPDGLKHAEKIAGELSLELIALSTSPFAVAQALTNADPDLSALIADIGAHTTDITLIEDGDIEGVETFDVGAQAFARHPSTALSVWLTALEIALEGLDITDTIPPKILLCGGGASPIEIPEALATTDWYERLPFPRRPIIDLIDPADISGVENRTGISLDPSFVPAVALLRIALDTIKPLRPTSTLRTKFATLLSH